MNTSCTLKGKGLISIHSFNLKWVILQGFTSVLDWWELPSCPSLMSSILCNREPLGLLFHRELWGYLPLHINLLWHRKGQSRQQRTARNRTASSRKKCEGFKTSIFNKTLNKIKYLLLLLLFAEIELSLGGSSPYTSNKYE